MRRQLESGLGLGKPETFDFSASRTSARRRRRDDSLLLRQAIQKHIRVKIE
jgi:hypothetical protein